MTRSPSTSADQNGPVRGVGCSDFCSARIVEGDSVVKDHPFSQHGTMRRDDRKGVVLRTREHPTLGFLLLVQHPGRKAPIWWSANHWKLSAPNASDQPRPTSAGEPSTKIKS